MTGYTGMISALLCPFLLVALGVGALVARVGNAYARAVSALHTAVRQAFGAAVPVTGVRFGARAVATYGDARLSVETRVRNRLGARLPGRLPYVRAAVDVQGALRAFAVERVTLAGAVAAVVGAREDVGTGDRAFDTAWIVRGDRALARAMLDPAARARLGALQAHSDVAQPGRPVVLELVRDGLAVRWWGAPEAGCLELARDLLLEMRAHLLEQLAREALAGAGGGAFRAGVRVEPGESGGSGERTSGAPARERERDERTSGRGTGR